MNRHLDFELVQDYLDGELSHEQSRELEAHLADCAECARELASYRLVFERLEHLPLFDPGPGLVDRVLAEALPAHPARWVRLAGWAYGVSLAASLGGLALALAAPVSRAWLFTLTADAARSLVRAFLFVMQSLNTGLVHAVELVSTRGEWLRSLPALQAVLKPLSQPVVLFTIWAALLVGVALLWWMRPQRGRTMGGSRHVGVLGF
ncbi:MAG: zf-HC2 domain-containing protein [Candidatus Eisenbacteria bacterium]|nr:zf-HC2 domain-containing protein [Candidatus Eisenbacteria bacterium]